MSEDKNGEREQEVVDHRSCRRKTDKQNARKHNLFLDMFAYGTLVLAFAMFILYLFWSFYPYQIIEITNARIASSSDKPGQAVVHQGDLTTYSNDYVKSVDLPADATREFVDGLIFDAGSYSSNLPVGSGHVVRELPIPETLPPGKYRVLITLRYQVNPVRVISVKFKTDEFTVLENKAAASADASADASIDKDTK